VQPPHDSDARLAAIVASSEDAIISKTLGGVITTWNAGAERMFGYTPDEAIGRHITMLMPPERLSEEDYVIAQVKAGVGIRHYETVRCRKDGSRIQVSLSVSPIRNADGEIVGASKIARDVTHAKRIEREALQLAAIVSSSEDAILSKDLNGVIQTWNRGAEKIFGYTAEEMIGRSITTLIPEERLGEETEVLSRVRAGLSVEHFETVRRRKDGSLVNISLTVSPVRTASGEIIGASKIARDITEQRRLRSEADAASRQKDEFLAVLSHELRTPLNTVLGYARMLKRDDERLTGPLRTRALEALERNADMLTKLVHDVLDTSRIVTGKLRLTLKDCAVDRLIGDAIDTVAPTAAAKDIAIEHRVARDLWVRGDRDRLQQVLWNLLSNAIKFTAPAGTITVHAELRTNGIAIVVSDNGIGIAPDHLPFVFQRFWQAHTGASREYGGLGIGLALTRHLVELHGGAISAESEGPGRGATFTIVLPAAVQKEALRRAK
jgi:PAS domain S-box-containing protein